MITLTPELIQKYSKPGPRYTSYPTTPEWHPLNHEQYHHALAQFGKTDKTLSLYIHIPFCQTMCYYCGCNVVIRKQKPEIGDTYIDYLEKEITLVSSHIQTQSTLKQLHLGGGTPNFLSSAQLTRLMQVIRTHFKFASDAEIAIEIDPRSVVTGQLETLKILGFNRLSMGIQDFDLEVQKAVNRIQPFPMIQTLINNLRTLKFSSINMDLIYGLPKQTLAHFKETIEKVITLKPDRIALYSFAHIPWLKSHQNLIDPDTLPQGEEKLGIFIQARNQLLENGYNAIAMDHFALASDELSRSFKAGRLYRNFMGYTLKPADEYVGIGTTAIGFIENMFTQNTPNIKDYYAQIDQAQLPVHKGLPLSQDDQRRQWVIQQLMCHFFIDKKQFESKFGDPFDTYFLAESHHLSSCESESLLTQTRTEIRATELGKLFVRNIAMGFDAYLLKPKMTQRFSNTI